MFTMHVFELTLIKMWFQSSLRFDVNLGCQLVLVPPVGSVLVLMLLCGELALGADAAT